MIFDRIKQTRSFLASEGLGPFIVRALAGTGAVRLAAMVGSFAVGVQLARLLGVDGYGYYGLALSIITIAGVPGELGISRVVTREIAASVALNDQPRLFGALRWARQTVLRLSAMMAAIAVAAVCMAAAIYPSVPAFAVLVGAAVIPLMAIARVNGGALQGLHHVVRGQIPAILFRPLLISLGLIAAYVAGVHIGVSAAMALNSLAAGIVAIVTYAWLQQRLPKRRPDHEVRKGRQWIASSIPMALTDGMRTLQTELSILLVGIIAAPAAVGLFRVATATTTVAAAAGATVVLVAAPITARLHAEGDRVRLQKAVTALAFAQFGGVLILSLPLLIVPELLLRIVFGEPFVRVATALQVLVVGQIINAGFGPNTTLLNMTHHERRVTRAMATALAVNVISVPLFVFLWGLVGAATAFVASILTLNVIAWRDAQQLLGIQTAVTWKLGR